MFTTANVCETATSNQVSPWSRSEAVAATVAICTYNGARRIESILAALSRQDMPRELWEVLVIDNASTDGVGETAASLLSLYFGKRGRVVREPRPGLSFARERASIEALGHIVCFLDDDNIPSPDFVSSAVQAFMDHPKAGVIGGKVLPHWETEPTPLAKAVAPFALAIRDKGENALPLGIADGIVGAGMCLRRRVICEIYSNGLASQVTDRKETSLMSGGDDAISIMARKLGWECWYVPTLKIEHLIPARRMEKGYLIRLYDGIGRGNAANRKCFDWKARTPLAILIAAKDLARWLRRSLLRPKPRDDIVSRNLLADLNDLEKRFLLARTLQALHFS